MMGQPSDAHRQPAAWMFVSCGWVGFLSPKALRELSSFESLQFRQSVCNGLKKIHSACKCGDLYFFSPEFSKMRIDSSRQCGRI